MNRTIRGDLMMMKHLLGLGTVALTLSGLLLLQPDDLQAETIVIAADTWCPYNCEPGSDRPGFMVEIAQTVLGTEDVEVEYRVMPWSRAIKSANEGRVHGIIGATREEAEGFALPKYEQGMSSEHFYTQPDSDWTYHNLSSLESVKLGLIESYEYPGIASHIEKYRNTPRIQVSLGDKALLQNIRKLRRGRVDVVVEDRNVMGYVLAESDQKDAVREAGTTGERQAVFIAFSYAFADADALAKKLSDGMAALRASGKLQKILDRYGLTDWVAKSE